MTGNDVELFNEEMEDAATSAGGTGVTTSRLAATNAGEEVAQGSIPQCHGSDGTAAGACTVTCDEVVARLIDVNVPSAWTVVSEVDEGLAVDQVYCLLTALACRV